MCRTKQNLYILCIRLKKCYLGSAYEGDSHTQLPLHAARERARLLVALVLKVQQNQHFFYIFIHVLAAF